MRSQHQQNSALIFYLIGKKTGGGSGEIVTPSGDWNTIVTDTVSGYLPWEQQIQNAVNVNNFFKEKGWALTPRMALLGNMTGESTINPGLIEVGGGTTSDGPGRGLVQWTPGTALLKVLDVLYGGHADWSDGNKQLAAMWAEYEEASGLANRGIEKQWYATSAYPISYAEWAHDTSHNLDWLVYAFMANYLRPATLDHPERVTYANQWANHFIKG